MKDGWGMDYQVAKDNNGEIEIKSEKYNTYQTSKGKGSLFNSNKES